MTQSDYLRGGIDPIARPAPRSTPINKKDGAPSFSRIPSIDGLRAIAILIVMVSHGGLGRYVPGGFGVTIFFFLSGYLITTLLRLEHQRHGRVNLSAFYFRRALRILPPLYLTISFILLLTYINVLSGNISIISTLIDVLFLTNYSQMLGVHSSAVIPLWSLDVEEHYYLMFPAIFVFLASWRTGRAAILLCAICAVILLIRFLTFANFGESQIYYWSHTRIDSIVFGSILAMWQNPMLDKGAWRPHLIHIAFAFIIIGLTIVIRSPIFRETLRYSLQGGALFILFTAAIQSRGIVARLLDQRWLRVVALLSYSLYLVHLPMLAATKPLGLWSVPVAYLLSFFWAAVLYTGVERPLARRRRRVLEKVIDGSPVPHSA